jgi:hypothetical protein
MGMNSTDIFHDQSESILCEIESEHAWGVPPHGVRRIGISGSNGRGGVSWKYREVSERRKMAILSHLIPPKLLMYQLYAFYKFQIYTINIL